MGNVREHSYVWGVWGSCSKGAWDELEGET